MTLAATLDDAETREALREAFHAGYNRATADFAGAPFSMPVVWTPKMEVQFERWLKGDPDA